MSEKISVTFSCLYPVLYATVFILFFVNIIGSPLVLSKQGDRLTFSKIRLCGSRALFNNMVLRRHVCFVFLQNA